MSAEDLKNQGSDAYRAGNYSQAVEDFSAAIALETGTSTEAKQFSKLVYSNRSAAYLQLKEYGKALADANKIVESLDPEWSKGYVRRGDAYFALKDYTRAYNAYQRAERLDPSESAYKAKTEKALEWITYESQRNSTRSSANGGGFGSGNVGGARSAPPVSGTLGHIKGLCGKGVGIFFLLYILPLSWIPFVGSYAPNNMMSYKLIVVASIIANAIALYSRYGFPKFSIDWAAQVMNSVEMGPVLLGLMLLAARPYVLGVLPLLLLELNNNMEYFATQIKAMLPQARAMPQAAAMAPQLAALEQMISTSSGIQHLKNEVSKGACTCEVLQGVFLVVELILPTRSFILAYMWWQYLMMRYLMDPTGHIKIAFSNLDGNITQLTAHQYCPSIVRKGYDMVKSFMANQIKSKQDEARSRAAGGSGAGSEGGFINNLTKSCTIS